MLMFCLFMFDLSGLFFQQWLFNSHEYCNYNIVGTLELAENARPSKGSTVSVFKLFNQSPHQQSSKSSNRIMTDILSKVQSLAIVHCGQASFTLRDERKGKVILNTGRVKNVRGTASVKSFY